MGQIDSSPKLKIKSWFTSPISQVDTVPAGYTGIYTINDFLNINNDLSGKYILMNDLDFSSYGPIEPIGYGGTFTGILNGNGHVISNIEFKENYDDKENVGLFSKTDGAEISNLGLENVHIQGQENVGAIAGRAENTTFSNCYVTGTVSGNYYNIGGLAGYAQNVEVTNCYSTANVSGRQYIGGLIGVIENGNVSNSYTTGNISGSEDYTGGLIGLFDGTGTVFNCYTTGRIEGANRTAGLIGNNYATIENCYTSGEVIAKNNYTAGLIADNHADITNCYTTGNVTSQGNCTAGLIAGNAGNITNCYTTGNVTGDSRVGGLIGINNGTVNICYTTSNVTGTEHIGGLIGIVDGGIVSNCYTTGNVTGDSRVGGLVGILNGALDHSYTISTVNGNNLTGAIAGELQSGDMDHVLAYTRKRMDTFTDDSGIGNIDRHINNSGALPLEYFTARPSHWYDFDTNIWDLNTNKNEAPILKSFSKEQQNTTLQPPETKPPVTPDNPDTPDAPTPPSGTGGNIRLQVGPNSSIDANAIYIDISFDLEDLSVDFSDAENCIEAVKTVDKFLKEINDKMAYIGATQNRLDSVEQSQITQIENFTAAKSTIMDADIAQESAEFTKQQILTQTSSALLVQANRLNANTAMSLINSLM